MALSALVAGTAAGAVPEIPACKGALEPSVAGGCGSVPAPGCCDALGRNLWCQGGNLYCLDCNQGFAACGWNPLGYYDCGQAAGVVDPGGVAPIACDPCPDQCAGSGTCSPECPGLCGTCPAGEVCLQAGECYAPQCGKKECGSDANGFPCGTCPGGTVCVDGLFACHPPPAGCVPGPGPGCGGCECEPCVCAKYPTCCTDHWDLFCATACVTACAMDCSPCPAEPDCKGVECGTYCGADCGTCPAGQVCVDHACCVQECQGKECGPDGCGGTCGACGPFDECAGGICVACKPQCGAGIECGPDGCGGSCGECAPGDACESGHCIPCVPACQGKDCGDDGCGGECGPCLKGQTCGNGVCVGCGVLDFAGCCDGHRSKWCQSGKPHTEACATTCGWNPAGYYDCGFVGEDPSGKSPLDCHACVPSCAGRACGSDGCGGSCGSCKAGATCLEGLCLAGEPCGAVTEAGCCEVGRVRWCSGGALDGYECGAGVPCGWDAGGPLPGGWYDCGFTGADPSGTHAMPCSSCQASCNGKSCGDDGCGGSCGACPAGWYCSAAGACSEECSPACAGRHCGDDGCGGSCGDCPAGSQCAGGTCSVASGEDEDGARGPEQPAGPELAERPRPARGCAVCMGPPGGQGSGTTWGLLLLAAAILGLGRPTCRWT